MADQGMVEVLYINVVWRVRGIVDADLFSQIANGEEVPLKQENIPIKGHAVEARIYAEDPYEGFLPCAGPLTYFDPPRSEESVRIETGAESVERSENFTRSSLSRADYRN